MAAGWLVGHSAFAFRGTLGLLGQRSRALADSEARHVQLLEQSPDVIVAETPWRHDKLRGGGGGAIDIGVHQFHLLRYVFGEVDWVSATARTFEPTRYARDGDGNVLETVTANVDDTYLATAGFENDAIGQLLWSWAGHGVRTSFWR